MRVVKDMNRRYTARSAGTQSSAAKDNGGFTIVELMVATLVFSVILVVVTSGILFFSKNYYRGASSSNVQATSRRIAEVITQNIQFSNATVSLPENDPTTIGEKKQFCAGGYAFVFREGALYTKGSSLTTNPGLYMRPMQSGGTCAPLTDEQLTGGQQLLGDNMRLTHLSLTGGDRVYTLSFKVAYGDDDLLTAPTGENVECRPGRGSEYCSVSGLSVSVQKRVN